MKILLNQKEVTVDSPETTVAKLVELKQLPSFGVAIAVNNKVVRKADWGSTVLHEGDNITLISAVCGG